MRILYLIFVFSVSALLFTALAAARHIRRHEERRKSAAGDNQSPDGGLESGEPKTEALVPAGKSHSS